MKFDFEIGLEEKHHVEFSWGKFFGVAKIWVDGALILKSQPLALKELSQAAKLRKVSGSINYLSGMASGSSRPELTTGWTIDVGQKEKHTVRIEKERPLVLAALRPHTFRVYVDGAKLRECVG